MPIRSLTVIVVLGALLQPFSAHGFAAEPIGKAVESPVEAEWLDRARAALDEWIATPDSHNTAPVPLDVAAALVTARGNEQDRETLLHALKVPLPPFTPREKTQTAIKNATGVVITDKAHDAWARENDAIAKLLPAKAWIALGDVEKARAQIAESRTEFKAIEGAPKPLGLDVPDLLLRDMSLRLRSPAEDEELLRRKDLGLLMMQAERCGRRDLAERMLEKIADDALAAAPEKQRDGEWINYRKIVASLVRYGQHVKAKQIAAKLEGYHKHEALTSIADAHYQRGESMIGDACFLQAVAVADPDAILFLTTARDFGRTAVLRAAVESRLESVRSAVSLSALTRFAGATGDAALFDRCMTAALAAEAREFSAKESVSPSSRVDVQINLAAGYASAGLYDKMKASITAATAIHGAKSSDVAYAIPYVLQALAWRGEDDMAEAIGKEHFKDADDFDFSLGASYRYHMLHEQFAKAYTQASKYSYSHMRHLLQARALHGMITSGQSQNAIAEWSAIKSPQDRAVIALTIADLLNGKRELGEQIITNPHDSI